MKLVWMYFLCSLGLFVPMASAQSVATTEPEANPGRPTVSTPATLPPVGYLQFENGVLFASDSPEFSKRTGTSQVTKLALVSRLELFLQTEPLVVSELNGPTAVHEGEVFAGAQGVIFAGARARPTISVSYIRRAHASFAPELDLGTFRQSTSVLASSDLRGFHVDANGIITEQILGLVHRAQFGQTLSVSRPIGKFIISGEIWHFSQPFLRSNAVGNLWAASYSLRKNLMIDAGFDHGLTATSTHWEAFVGFTYLLPHRLWMERRSQTAQFR